MKGNGKTITPKRYLGWVKGNIFKELLNGSRTLDQLCDKFCTRELGEFYLTEVSVENMQSPSEKQIRESGRKFIEMALTNLVLTGEAALEGGIYFLVNPGHYRRDSMDPHTADNIYPSALHIAGEAE